MCQTTRNIIGNDVVVFVFDATFLPRHCLPRRKKR